MLIWAWVAAASAADCLPLDRGVMVRGLDKVDEAYRAGDPVRAGGLLEVIGDRLPCLIEPVSAGAMARYGALRAIDASMDQDQAWVERWARAALWADLQHGWPDYLSADHPARTAAPRDATVAEVGLPKRGLSVPEGGGMLLSGKLVTRPWAPAEVPLLRQVFDAEGTLVEAGWQDGAAFPERWLSFESEAAPEPTWWTGDTMMLDAPTPDPDRTLWGTAVVLLGGGSSAQRTSDPGDFLTNIDRSGALVGLGSHGAVLPGPVGAAWEARIAPASGVGLLEGWALLGVPAGPVVLLAGGGGHAGWIEEDRQPRPIGVLQPRVGVLATVELGGPWLEVAGAGGWLPSASHLAGRASVHGHAATTWTAGVDVGWLHTEFVQPGVDRAIRVDQLTAVATVGLLLAP